MLIVPPSNFLAKISPKTMHKVRINIFERNMVLAFDSELLKNRYSKIADKIPAKIPKMGQKIVKFLKNVKNREK